MLKVKKEAIRGLCSCLNLLAFAKTVGAVLLAVIIIPLLYSFTFHARHGFGVKPWFAFLHVLNDRVVRHRLVNLVFGRGSPVLTRRRRSSCQKQCLEMQIHATDER